MITNNLNKIIYRKFTLTNNGNLEPEKDFYWSPEGYKVFTEAYHLKRGYCCKSGCKHCPYGYNPKTSEITKKNNSKK